MEQADDAALLQCADNKPHDIFQKWLRLLCPSSPLQAGPHVSVPASRLVANGCQLTQLFPYCYDNFKTCHQVISVCTLRGFTCTCPTCPDCSDFGSLRAENILENNQLVSTNYRPPKPFPLVLLAPSLTQHWMNTVLRATRPDYPGPSLMGT